MAISPTAHSSTVYLAAMKNLLDQNVYSARAGNPKHSCLQPLLTLWKQAEGKSGCNKNVFNHAQATQSNRVFLRIKASIRNPWDSTSKHCSNCTTWRFFY